MKVMQSNCSENMNKLRMLFISQPKIKPSVPLIAHLIKLIKIPNIYLTKVNLFKLLFNILHNINIKKRIAKLNYYLILFY
jgi:hypothetical protein